MYNDKLGYSEFREVFFNNIDTLITNQAHIEQNIDFYEEVIFKTFEVYQKNGLDYTVGDILRFFHIFLYATFKYNPDNVLPEDDTIKLN